MQIVATALLALTCYELDLLRATLQKRSSHRASGLIVLLLLLQLLQFFLVFAASAATATVANICSYYCAEHLHNSGDDVG